MAAVQHLIEMAQGAHHGHHVILDVGEVESDFRAGRDAILVVAALGEALDDIGFPRQETHEGIDLFAAFGDLAEERGEVVGAGDENLIFDRVRLVFDRGDDGPEAVDDVVTVTESVSGWGWLMPSVRGEQTLWRSKSNPRSMPCSPSAFRSFSSHLLHVGFGST